MQIAGFVGTTVRLRNMEDAQASAETEGLNIVNKNEGCRVKRNNFGKSVFFFEYVDKLRAIKRHNQ